MLSRLIITFLPRSKHLLISWLQSPSAVILEPPEIKPDTVSPSISHEVMGPDVMVLVFWMLSFKPTFSLSSFTFIKRLFSYSSLSATRVVSSAYRRLLIFLPAILIPACTFSSPAVMEEQADISQGSITGGESEPESRWEQRPQWGERQGGSMIESTNNKIWSGGVLPVAL